MVQEDVLDIDRNVCCCYLKRSPLHPNTFLLYKCRPYC